MKIDEFFAKIEAMIKGADAAVFRAEKAEADLNAMTVQRDAEKARADKAETDLKAAVDAKATAEKERDDAVKAKADAEKAAKEAEASVPGKAAVIVAGARNEAPLAAGDATNPTGTPAAAGDIGAQWETISKSGSVREKSKFIAENRAAIRAYLSGKN